VDWEFEAHWWGAGTGSVGLGHFVFGGIFLEGGLGGRGGVGRGGGHWGFWGKKSRKVRDGRPGFESPFIALPFLEGRLWGNTASGGWMVWKAGGRGCMDLGLGRKYRPPRGSFLDRSPDQMHPKGGKERKKPVKGRRCGKKEGETISIG